MDKGSVHRSDAEEQASGTRGKLKIYLGYAAGVGKTAAMLDDACSLLDSGSDVVIGQIQLHSRPEIIRMAERFEKLPPLEVRFGAEVRLEFDLDAALRRHPKILLIDELAHVNAPGLRHKKRWQDVEELLAAGIDVYTAVNIQHIESLGDIVSTVTGADVQDTVPDSIFDEAEQMELIDIEPELLLQRVREGKAYMPLPSLSGEPFIEDNHLFALREIALRRCADRLSRRKSRSRRGGRNESWATLGESLLVCLSGSNTNAHVIRSASRIAEAFHTSWIGLYVRQTGRRHIPVDEQQQLEDNIALAERLGARVVSVSGDDVAGQIVQYARSHSVSRIVIGKNHRNVSPLRRLFAVDIADRIIAESPYIDVYVIPEQNPKPRRRYFSFNEDNWRLTLKDAAIVLVSLTAVTLLNLLQKNLGLPEANIVMLYLMGVLFVSNRTKGHLPGVLSSVLSVLSFNYFFSAPYFAFTPFDSHYAPTFALMLTASLITSALTSRIRRQAEITAARDRTNDILLQTSRVLMRAHDRLSLSKSIADHLVRLSGQPAVCYIPESPDSQTLPAPTRSSLDNELQTGPSPEEEEEAANWVFHNAKEAGKGTDTLPGVTGYYIPVVGENRTLAVLGISCEARELTHEQRQTLWAVAGQIALAIERETLSHAQTLAQEEVEREHLRASLLHAVSHDLRTPLAGIAGAANTVLDNDEALDAQTRRELLRGICDDADWLTKVVENLLSVTRIDEGRLKLSYREEMLEEIVAESIERVEKNLHGHLLKTRVKEPTATAVMDGRLIEQVLVNLIDNAVRYTPEGTEIQVQAWCWDGRVFFEVLDNGPGLNERDIPFLFDRFYTKGDSRSDANRGIGLGLSISKSIVSAHGGEITAENRKPAGAAFRFWLPMRQTGEST